jgi:hypothetical protein
MKRNHKTSSTKLTLVLSATNKKTVMDQVTESLMAKDVEYVTYSVIDEDYDSEQDDDQEENHRKPTQKEKHDGAKLHLQLNRIDKPNEAQIKRSIRTHDAMARTIMKEFIHEDDLSRAIKKGKSAWALYEWMQDYGKYGQASRVGTLFQSMGKQTLTKCGTMKRYLQKMNSLFESINEIQKGYIHQQMFFTLVLTNLGTEYTNAKDGPFRVVFKELSSANLKSKIIWEELEADLQSAWNEEYPDDEVDGQDSKTFAGKRSKNTSVTRDDVALAVKEAFKEYANNANDGAARKRKRDNGKASKDGNDRTRDDSKKKSKTECFNMRDTGRCRYGDRCRFNHKIGKDSSDERSSKRKKRQSSWSDDEASEDDEQSPKKKRRRRGETVFTAKELTNSKATDSATIRQELVTAIGKFAFLLFALVYAVVTENSTWAYRQVKAKLTSSSKTSGAKLTSVLERVTDFAGVATDTAAKMIIDSGATCHIVNSKELFNRMTNKRKVEGQQVSMNGHPENIEYRGDLDIFMICSKDRTNKVLVTLNNVAYVPASENCLFSSTAYLKSHHLRKPADAPDNHIVQTHDDIYIGGVDCTEKRKIFGIRDGDLWLMDIATNSPEQVNSSEETKDSATHKFSKFMTMNPFDLLKTQ